MSEIKLMVRSTLDKSKDTTKSSEVVNKKVTEGGSKVSHLVNAILRNPMTDFER